MPKVENTKIPDQLRKRADLLQKKIDAKLNPAIASQNLTPRRIAIANAMRQEGYRMQEHQAALRALAEYQSSPDGIQQLKDVSLFKVRYANQAALIMNKYSKAATEPCLNKIGIETEQQLEKARNCLLQMVEDFGTDKPSPEEAKLLKLEQDLVGQKIPGFFPTPQPLIDQMLDLLEETIAFDRPIVAADRLDQARILEPSAGKGDIAEALRNRYPSADLQVIEINHALANILELKGFTATQGDFLEIEDTHAFDAIIQNPPYENGQDIEHVRQAYRRLKYGGVLVSLISSGSLSRSDRRAQMFQEWLARRNADIVSVPGGSFKKAFRSTGVSVKIVVLKKD